jgi:hypothetical protein
MRVLAFAAAVAAVANAQLLGPTAQVYSSSVPSGVSTTAPTTTYANCMDLQTPAASTASGTPGMPGVRLYWTLNADGTSVSMMIRVTRFQNQIHSYALSSESSRLSQLWLHWSWTLPF